MDGYVTSQYGLGESLMSSPSNPFPPASLTNLEERAVSSTFPITFSCLVRALGLTGLNAFRLTTECYFGSGLGGRFREANHLLS